MADTNSKSAGEWKDQKQTRESLVRAAMNARRWDADRQITEAEFDAAVGDIGSTTLGAGISINKPIGSESETAQPETGRLGMTVPGTPAPTGSR